MAPLLSRTHLHGEKQWSAVCVLHWPASKVGSTATVLIISHITFRDCHVHIFSDNHSRNCCIWYFQHVVALTRGGGGGRHAPPWNLSNLGAQTSHFLSFPQDIFIKKNPKEMPYRISSNNIRGWLFLFSHQKGVIIRGKAIFSVIAQIRFLD